MILISHRYNKFLVAMLLAVPVTAIAAPAAVSTTATGCGALSTDKLTTLGPLPVGLSDSCFAQASSPLGNYTAASDVVTAFGAGLPQVGVVNASAVAIVDATDPLAPPGSFLQGAAQANGSVSFYFTVEEIRTPPATYTPKVYFEASGSGSFTGVETGGGDFDFEGSVASLVLLPDGTRWGIVRDLDDSDSSWSDSFSQTTNLDLPANDLANPFYEVTIAAGCGLEARAGGEYFTQAECQATVDPTVRFDQDAFDAAYGSDSFMLSDYYSLQFSDNINVIPLPAAVWLFGFGLAGLIAVARR